LRDETGAGVYLTGDTGYWLPNGGIRFTGRRDFQVKLNGMRIELGEIESALQQLEDIAQAAVAIIGPDGPHRAGRLVAYVASASVNAAAAAQSEAAERQAIGSYRTQLARWLPDYMLPSLFVFVPSLPLLSSGKVDRRALLALGTKTRSNDGYVAPRRHMEQSLCEIWQEVLGLERVGIHDNFFEAGGTSLLAMQVCAKLCSRTSRDLSVVDVFAYPTIDAFARFLEGAPDGAHAEQSGRDMPAAGTAGGIAIIGMACRFPDAVDTDAFWANVARGVESLRTYTPEELRAAGVDPALIDKPNFVPTRTLLGGVEDFDADYFDFTPREAEVTDPQHRVLLECANEALEAAGYGDAASSRSVGVFFGVGANLYLAHHLLPRIETFDLDAQAVYNANREYHCATRISYKLNLSGPSVSVNTACSTALVAVHQACRSLALGESQMALAGAASIGEFSPGGYLYQEGNILSPDGHCRAFDRDARGTRRGNGAGVVLLKRLDQALADGDIVHAVIQGTANNNDGSDKVGYTAPSVTGQARAITQAYRNAAVSPTTLQYVETHGTGTVLGDPIEIRALTQAFAGVEAQRCAIGSVKPNIGHLDAAAGIAGLIKTVEALKHRQLPPSINYAQANPQIDFDHSPFYVNTELKNWHCVVGPRRAGVSSFGIGGTNAHLVLEEAPVAPEPAPAGRKLQLLVLSARSADALQVASERLAAHLNGKDDMSLADVAYTLQTGRTRHAYRRAVVCETAKEAIDQLASPAPATEKASDQAASLVWMFPGQGAQHVNMARSLYATEPVFREQLDLCAAGLREALGLDLREVLYPPPGGLEEVKETLKQTWLAQPALFAVEYSLARLLQSYELRPEAMIGHSLGEYVAACLAGVFSLEQGLGLMAARGRLMQRMAPGRMLSVLKDEEELRERLPGNELSVAAVNAEGQCVVSGPFQAIEALRERLQSEGIETRELETSHAGHSAMMDPMLASWREVMRGVELSAPKLPYVSNLSGNFIREDEATDPEYWVKHLRQTVQFRKGLATLLSPGAPLKGKCVLVELGPGQALSGFAKRHPHGRAHSVVPLLPRAGTALDDARALHNGLGQLWVSGAQIDWQSYHGHERRRRVQLPTYPFERRRFWVEAPSAGRRVATANGSPRPEWRDWFHVPSWRLTPPPGMDSLQVSAQSRSCIVFAGESDLAALLIDELESRMARVFRVSSGTSYAYGAHSAVVDVTQPAHYRRLFDELKRDGRTFDTIVHAFNVDDTDDLGGGPWIYDPDALELSLYSVLYLLQALNECMPQQPVRLNLISSHLAKLADDDVVQPEKAVLTGICRVIPWEFPHITCKSIDVPDSRLAPHRQASLAASVALEVLSGVANGVVAYRGERRWAQAFERVEISAPPAQAPVFRHRGVYLVTGGLGGIGLAIAAYLAESVQARLVLIGRTGLPPRETWQSQLEAGADSDVGEKIRQVLRLEAYGGEVVVAQADVADIEQMHRVVADAVGRFGAIHGVIHAAGVGSDGLITTKTRDSVAAVIRPKIVGTVAIAKALEAFELDAFVMCSSMSAITGGFGQYDYSAANAFQDAFAVRHYGTASTRYLSINWGAWKEVGMAANRRLPDYLLKHKERHLQSAIPTSEGVNAFAAILARPLPQWLVTTRDPESLLSNTGAADLVARLTAQKNGRTQARPELATAYVAPRNGIEISLTGIWQELLGFEGIGIRDEFFELGGDSLLATRLLNRLHEVFSIMVSDYSMRDFFESPTIEAAAERIRSALMAAKLAEKRREMHENPQDVVEGVF
jgi:acyl transferase domain-containing protein